MAQVHPDNNARPMQTQNFFTLVSYTPEPLRSWLLDLRQDLGVHVSSEPHITILPPRPLSTTVEQARDRITAVLSRWRGFDVQLYAVRAFPETRVLYMDVSDGADAMRELHAQLNCAEFAHAELYPFHPHVTIGGPIEPENLDRMARKASEAFERTICPCRFQINDVALVSIQPGDMEPEWRRVWTWTLEHMDSAAVARGAAATSQTF
jgi:2'-5' RNA ligase